MPRIIHFEIAVDDPDRAVKFYKTVFGWKIDKWEGPVDYWLVVTGQKPEPGIDGALQLRKDARQPITNIIGVDSVDEYSERIQKAGGKIIVPKMAVPGVGWAAYAEDSEGNGFGMMQDDPDAK
ncbi:MAG: VOC family protein [Candidatus Hermodarchaeia archaeon]|jgi:predicted enzyme related to lactoylglutathione lyase